MSKPCPGCGKQGTINTRIRHCLPPKKDCYWVKCLGCVITYDRLTGVGVDKEGQLVSPSGD